MTIVTFMKDLLKTATSFGNGCEESVQLRDLRLPPARIRQCTAEFRDDDYFVASAEREDRELVEHCGLNRDSWIRALARVLRSTFWLVMRTLPIGWLVTRVNLMRHSYLTDRKLEIGPGDERVDGFETLDIILRRNVDFVADASRRLPFKDAIFQVVYASHILEHIPWYRLEETLREWVRILKPGGVLEIWVPNGLEICRVFVDYETTGQDRTDQDGWYRFNPEKDPCLWAAGRIFTHGDGHGELRSPNWHRAIFSPRFLHELMTKVGLVNVQEMDRAEVRGYDHGWINLGFRGTK